MNPLQRALQILKGTSNFLAPKATAAGSGVANTLGMMKDYLEYNTGNDKNKQLVEYNQKRNAANEALKQFGFDIEKKGNQFDAGQYSRGVIGGGGELASYASPVGGSMKARLAINAVPGLTDAIGKGKNLTDTAIETALTSLGGTGMEKLVKGAGAVIRGVGNKVSNSGEKLALKRLGLTKLDVNKFEKAHGVKMIDFLKEQALIGKGVEDIDNAIDPLQKSFDNITENPNLQVDPNQLQDTFGAKIKELLSSNAPELRSKGQSLKEYTDNLFSNNIDTFSGKGITKERRIIDQLVKDFDKSGDAVGASKNRVIRDILQDSVRTEAEKRGIKGVGEKTLTQLGEELKKLYSLSEVAAKRMPQPTGSPSGLYRLLAGSGGASTGAVIGGLPGAAIGAAGGIATEELLNNPKSIQKLTELLPKIGSTIAQGGDAVGSEGAQKLLQILGIKTGEGISDLVGQGSPENNASNQQENPNITNDVQNSMKKLVNPQNNTQPQTQMQEQFDPNEEITLLDGSKSTFGQLQQTGAFSNGQVQGAQDSPAPISDDQFQQLFVQDLIQNGGKNLDKLTMLKKVISPQEDIDTQIKQAQLQKLQAELTGTDQKPLTAAAENKVQLATSGLRALDSIESMIAEDPSKVLKSLVPGKIGARDYDSAAFRAVEGLLRARSGAAIPETEVRRYMSANLPKFGDNQKEIEFKLSAFRKDLEDVTKSGGGTDQEALLKMLGL